MSKTAEECLSAALCVMGWAGTIPKVEIEQACNQSLYEKNFNAIYDLLDKKFKEIPLEED